MEINLPELEAVLQKLNTIEEKINSLQAQQDKMAYTTSDAALKLGISESQIRNLINAGTIQAVPTNETGLHRKHLIPHWEITRFLQNKPANLKKAS